MIMANIEKELESLESASKSGDFRASYRLAQMYNQGLNVKKDVETASEYFDLAFRQLNEAPNSDETNYFLGTFYLYGLGTVSKDEEKAFSLFKKNADHKEINGMIMVANAYLNGIGINKDPEEGFRIINEIKDSKHPLAYKIYADCKLKGLGTMVDEKEAVKYYKLAAENNDIISTYILGLLYRDGKGVEQNYKVSLEYLEKAASYNYPDALKQIAFFYSQGICVKKDTLKEAEYLKRYADTGIPDGMFIYGSVCLDRQKGLFKYQEGLDYLKRAVALNEPKATHVLGKIYENGEYGVFVNKGLAFNHYLKAYNLGLKNAAFDVLRCLKQNIGVSGTPAKIDEFEQICKSLKENMNNQA